jgi:hypothetical protein
LKRKLKERELSTWEQIIQVIPTIWEAVIFEELQSMFAEWVQRLAWVCAESGEDYTKPLRQLIYNLRIIEKNSGRGLLGPPRLWTIVDDELSHSKPIIYCLSNPSVPSGNLYRSLGGQARR